ncbi:hypothetical protein CHLNCDRAFT_137783 [Chlorella variabilis]|uniref:DNA topoisomerase 2 n=1 Tax=Chlorella variabilis TaxID=554065 RepID=E1Z4H4_CHLVA|nr:hypothetical protein CHLNCDRAFT_137783 [Chlorella variabilis]EFN59062.1 hypothetical protein CHLNCDRAFT_137783 [Chlorella variabilis]|eukprot:XP_005851164.1 hypothetical protein CHLNCDRAFT_137783 [Chlorella variabilis]
MEVDAVSENGGKVKAAKAPLAVANKGGKTIEETYQKVTQVEHVLLRPDTYIGSTERQQQQLWVHDGERMVHKSIDFVPGLYKIFDEILVNAADNKVRDASMDTLRVDVDADKGSIKVMNNGAGIPVEVHKTEGIYVPELIFGNLLTSSNYNDNEKKVTGGRNGYGAKLANIFSTKFVVETCDGKRGRRYKQTFTQNMSKKGQPVITDCKADENWTCITFYPDLARFGMEDLEQESVELMRKRVYDMAGLLGKTVKVFYNGQRLKVKSFQEYVDMYLGPKDEGPTRVYERISDRWEVCIAPTEGQFNQVSFVNAICTSKGGTHVNYISDQVVKYLCDMINKKDKKANVKPFMAKNYLWVFVNCLIENPAFDSQTKDTLTLRASSFGSKCDLPDAFLKKVANCGVVNSILSFASFKADKELKKGDGAKRQRLTGIPKLEDANDAGGRNSAGCTLILTEGDSAKSLAVAGLSVVGRDRFGVFPLRGKLLNVRDASAAQITGNAEIQNIKQILGLQHGKVYTDAKSLRYGHLMIMTDQDHDGSHIKGLIMNYFHHFYPSLLKLPGFLVEFITPIIKATKGKETISFYTMPEYEEWSETHNTRGWTIKYFKGLGTSTADEAKQYFANIQSHRKEFVWDGDADGQALEMAFSKKKVEDRKQWLQAFSPGTFLDHTADTISYSQFVHKELILFSRADLERSIPNMVDGLKPGQRKIMFACFKRNLKTDVKVSQLSGYVSEHSAYHHGEASLSGTIVGLAQDFVGSNNVNYLVPQGQFGTRLQGGKDAASPRYIFTRLAPLTRHLFNEHDDRLLAYLNEEGQSIEPEWYMPVVPTVLVNGAEGIGTGWSTSIPNFNPRDIVANLRLMLDGEQPVAMKPWYRGFKGTIEEVPTKTSGKSYQICGVINQVDDTTLDITELPIRKWTQDYKEFLEEMVKPEDKNATPFIQDYKEYHTDLVVHFRVTLSESKMREALAAGLLDKFKLKTKISTGNMMLFNAEGAIQKYASPEDILRDFYDLRLAYYVKRRAALLRAAEADLLRISNKVRFILAVVGGQLKLSNRRKKDVEGELEDEGYDKLPNQKKAAQQAAIDEGEDGDGEGGASAPASYDYLLSMPLSSLTLEKVQALQSESEDWQATVQRLRATTEKDMWRSDLDAFEMALDGFDEEAERKGSQLVRQQARAKAGQKAQAKKAAAKSKGKRNQWSDDESDADLSSSEDDFDDSEDERPQPKKAPAPRQRAVPAPRAAPAPLGATSMQISQQTGAAAAGTKKPAAAARKPAAARPKAAAAKPAASRQESEEEEEAAPVAAPPPPPEEEMSLLARLAGRMGKLGLSPGGPAAAAPTPSASRGTAATGAGARPGRAAAAAAAKKTAKVVVISEDEDEESEEESESELEFSDDDDEVWLLLLVNSPAVKPEPKKRSKPEPKKTLAAKAMANTSKPSGSGSYDFDLANEEAASPVPAPKAKVQRMRPSPFNKNSGKPKAAAAAAPRPASNLGKKAAAPAAGGKGKGKAVVDSSDSEDEDDVVDMTISPAPARQVAPRRAAVNKPAPKYRESGSEEEESESENESDYAPSD